MIARTREEVDGMRSAGAAVRFAFDAMKSAVRPGISTAELDVIGDLALRQRGARSAPRSFYDFPGATCISVNEEAAHGIPGERVLVDGDLINIDVSAELDGFVADMGESFPVAGASPEQSKLVESVKRAVHSAMDVMRAGARLNDIGATVSRVAAEAGYQIIENLGSHGLGRSLHEPPSYVPIDNPTDRRTLDEGLVLTLEPFFSDQARWVEEASDGWTLKVPPNVLVAQYEHTFVIRADAPPVVVTAPNGL